MNDLERLYTRLQSTQSNGYRDLRLVPSATPVGALLARAQAEKMRRRQAEQRVEQHESVPDPDAVAVSQAGNAAVSLDSASESSAEALSIEASSVLTSTPATEEPVSTAPERSQPESGIRPVARPRLVEKDVDRPSDQKQASGRAAVGETSAAAIEAFPEVSDEPRPSAKSVRSDVRLSFETTSTPTTQTTHHGADGPETGGQSSNGAVQSVLADAAFESRADATGRSDSTTPETKRSETQRTNDARGVGVELDRIEPQAVDAQAPVTQTSAVGDTRIAAERLDADGERPFAGAIPAMDLLQRLRKAPLVAVGRDVTPPIRVAVYSPSGGSGVSTVAAVAARVLSAHRPTTLIDTDGSGSLSILTTSSGRSLEAQHSPLCPHAFNGAWAFGGVTTWFLRASHIDRWLPRVVGEPVPGPTIHWVIDWPRNYWSELFDVMGSLTALLIPLRMDTSALIASERMASMLKERGFIGHAGAPKVTFVLNGFRESSALHRDLRKHFSERFSSIAQVVTVPYDERFDSCVAAGDDVVEQLGFVEALSPVFEDLVTGDAHPREVLAS